ncbi:MAG: hypothetical protein ACAI44_27470, partial [Candidatus Sericytochromatia bacterium]
MLFTLRSACFRLLTFSLLWLLSLPALADRLTLFHTGNTGGLASTYRYDIQQPYLLASAFVQQQGAEARLQDFSVAGNTIPFYSQNNYLWGPGFGIRQLRGFLAATPEPESRREVVLLQSSDSLLADPSDLQGLMNRLDGWLRRSPGLRENFRIRQAELIRYPGPVWRLRLLDGAEKPSANPLDWELLIGFELSFRSQSGQAAPLMVIGQPQGEGSRRMHLIEQLRGPADLLVDSGNLLEGLSSVATNRLSLQRENSLRMVQALKYDAINLGKNELLGGIEHLRQEQQRYQLPLISASLKSQGKYLFEPYKIIHSGQFRLALIGIGDNAEFENLRAAGLLPADTEILEPAAALTQALQALRSQEDVELVALLTHLEGAELQKLTAWQQDVQLVLANPDTPLQHVRETVVLDGTRQARPLVVSSNPLAICMLQLASDGNDLELSAEQLPVYFDNPPDRRFLPELMAVRQSAYEDALDPLLPDLGPLIRRDPKLMELFMQSAATRAAARRLHAAQPSEQLISMFPPYLTAELLANLEMNGLMEAFNAEVVALRLDQGMELTVPGALPRLLVYERLKTGDTLERYYLNGDQLKKLLDLKLTGLVFGGASPERKQVWGREIGDRRSVYRLLIPSGLAGQSAVRPLLANLRHDSLLDSPFDTDGHLARLYVRDTVLALLERLSLRPDYAEQLSRLMKPNWQDRKLVFSLQLDNFQLSLSGYNALNNKTYAEVRETRVTSPSSFTFGGRSRLALGLDNQTFGFTTAAAGKYEALSVLEEAPAAAGKGTTERFSENQDDLLFSAELQLRLLEFPLFDNRLLLTPYLETIYDTEFTPTLNKDTRAFNPLQSELRGVLGLAIPPAGPLKSFKTGFALRRDFNVPDNLEAGLDLKLLYDQPI